MFAAAGTDLHPNTCDLQQKKLCSSNFRIVTTTAIGTLAKVLHHHHYYNSYKIPHPTPHKKGGVRIESPSY